VLRVILRGVFDRIPNLELIVGHMGETLPFMMSRVYVMTPEVGRLQPPGQPVSSQPRALHLRRLQLHSSFLDLLLQVGSGRIMFSADYPYGSMAETRAFLEKLPVSPAERERIAHGNG
jgi:predicted TIM-barrel fold metal-dependent hydrolase